LTDPYGVGTGALPLRLWVKAIRLPYCMTWRFFSWRSHFYQNYRRVWGWLVIR